MSLFSSLKKLDIYRDIPKDLTEQTLHGAIVSVVCALLVTYLFLSEFLAYMTVATTSEMFVDSETDQHSHATIAIRMNFTVPSMPCAITSVDVQDILGSHVVDYGGKLHRWRTDEEGKIKYTPLGQPLAHDSVTPAEQRGEGCNIEGTLIVKQVPGNFHVSAHAHPDLLQLYYPQFPQQNLNLTHTIHSLIFGHDSHQLNEIDEHSVAFDTLSGARKVSIMEPQDQGAPRSYEYYIKVVPTKYTRLSSVTYDGYQYVSNSNVIVGRFQMPAIYFRYDFSPITVNFKESKPSLAHFLVQICAIVGGVFTVLGLVNGVVNQVSKKFKHGINKLG